MWLTHLWIKNSFPCLNTAHCTLHTAHCTLHTAYCTLHTAHCTLHTAHCTPDVDNPGYFPPIFGRIWAVLDYLRLNPGYLPPMYRHSLSVSAAHGTRHTAHCTLHTAHCTLHTAHCTLHCSQVELRSCSWAATNLHSCQLCHQVNYQYYQYWSCPIQIPSKCWRWSNLIITLHNSCHHWTDDHWGTWISVRLHDTGGKTSRLWRGDIQGDFFYWSPLNLAEFQIPCKIARNFSKCQRL